MSGGYQFFPKARPRGLLPPRTVSEIAEMLGISKQQLIGALRSAPDAPKPVLRNCIVNGGSRVWYEPRAVIKWYRARQGSAAA
jgi:hypothetical protein